ncbi:hypothetical protein BCR35DRAFT_69749 [Leucosporidium creatinivorum]|uniref:Uncharacterized protein n=1 Tax=Leucosporidium creatinivorum TaxID=106004 RepID=A0A1Y2G2E2_9BASI|nr:hypothetical protein BCR35DRAFT_69749 [Leucosporidium creatinivorum]
MNRKQKALPPLASFRPLPRSSSLGALFRSSLSLPLRTRSRCRLGALLPAFRERNLAVGSLRRRRSGVFQVVRVVRRGGFESRKVSLDTHTME